MQNLHLIYIPLTLVLLSILSYYLYHSIYTSCPKTTCTCQECQVCPECLDYRLDMYTKPIHNLMSISGTYRVFITKNGLEHMYIYKGNDGNMTNDMTTLIPVENASKFRGNEFGQIEILDDSDKVLIAFPESKPFVNYIPYYIHVNNDGKIQCMSTFDKNPIPKWEL